MFVRVVRFTDVTPQRIDQLVSRIEESDGPPPGVPASGLRLMFDPDQGTAVAVQFFDSEQDMRQGAEVLSAMDPSDTPGTRASVDMGEVKIERDG